MEIDPTAGLSPSLTIGLVAGALFFVVASTGIVLQAANEPSVTKGERIKACVAIVALFIALGTVAAAAIFSAAFSVLNIALQYDLYSADAFRYDLGSGLLTLRIVSIVLLLKILAPLSVFLAVLPDHVRRPSRPTQLRPLRRGSYEPYQGGERVYDVDLAAARLGQYGFFLAVLTLLWVLNAQNVESLIVVVLSFALLFIVDDWVIISEYLVPLNGLVVKSHRARIDIANVAIAPAAVWAAYTSLPGVLASMASAAIVLTLCLRYVKLHGD